MGISGVELGAPLTILNNLFLVMSIIEICKVRSMGNMCLDGMILMKYIKNENGLQMKELSWGVLWC